jgi:hypothetical protein
LIYAKAPIAANAKLVIPPPYISAVEYDEVVGAAAALAPGAAASALASTFDVTAVMDFPDGRVGVMEPPLTGDRELSSLESS